MNNFKETLRNEFTDASPEASPEIFVDQTAVLAKDGLEGTEHLASKKELFSPQENKLAERQEIIKSFENSRLTLFKQLADLAAAFNPESETADADLNRMTELNRLMDNLQIKSTETLIAFGNKKVDTSLEDKTINRVFAN
jgi:predicted transcriptional regulator